MSFLDLRKNFGAETERTRDLFTALWIPDLFMKQVETDGDWYLMCPNKCPGLTEVYGEKFEELYWSYVKQNKFNIIIKAKKIMNAILDSQLETGTPYIAFKDHINKKSNQKNIGIIKSSNLCVHENTLILTDQGYKNIKSLENQHTTIWNGDEWSSVIVKKTGTNQNLIRVNFSNGVSLDCTKKHIFYIKEQNENKTINYKVHAYELLKNDNLISFNLPDPIEYNDCEKCIDAYTYGMFFSIGCSINNKFIINTVLYNDELLSKINYKSYTTLHNHYTFLLNDNFDPTTFDINKISIADRIKWLEGYCDSNKEIKYNKASLYLELNIEEHKSNALYIRLMLHTLGIESTIQMNNSTIQMNNSTDEQMNKQIQTKTDYKLYIQGINLEKLLNLGFNILLQECNISFIPLYNLPISVSSIEDSYKNVDTYCFTEPKKNKGIFNGIITGQCAEIVQYSDAKEYSVCNLASIAINKFVMPFEANHIFKIYTKDNCKYCNWAKLFLTNKNYEYEAENVDSNTLKNLSGLENPTYPQIFYDNKLIGGFTELFKFVKSSFDYDKLYEVAYTSTINLNNIIDINYYPVPETKLSNIKHRPIGLGIQGLADALVLLKINFESEECCDFNSKIMETIYLAAMTASNIIAKNRYQYMYNIIQWHHDKEHIFPEYYDKNLIFVNDYGNVVSDTYHYLKPNLCELNKSHINKYIGAYSTFEGSPLSQGQFQFDLWDYDRNKLFYKEKWELLEQQINQYGTRNSLLTSLMPTASTSQILGNNECFEPFTNNIYTRRTLAGDFPLVNKYLIDDLNNLDLWTNEMKQLILANNGSIANFNTIPQIIKDLYKTVWEIKQSWILKNTLARSPFVDQSQSMNIFFAVPDYQKLYSSHMWAWKNGLKTGIYYLRSKPATNAAKVTVDPNLQKQLNEVCENCSA
jgi:ribonucleotide reductase alpha subunit